MISSNIVKKHFTDHQFWNRFISCNMIEKEIKNKVEYLLLEFGTKEPCNRFDIGNCIEFIINDYLLNIGFQLSELPNAKRYDVDINNYKKLSIKYSSSGNIKLHNSLGSNQDECMKDTILLTPNKLYLITNEELEKYRIDLKIYLKNTKDGLELKRSLLTILNKKKYSFIYEININHNKEFCKNRLCSKLFYRQFLQEYNSNTNL